MVLNIQVRMTQNVTPKLRRLHPNIETENEKSLKEFTRYVRDRARQYSADITGPASQGVVSGKLLTAIQGNAGKRNASVFIMPSRVTKGKYNYGVLQERGFGPIQGYHAVRTQQGWRMRKGGRFPRVKGKRFMQRAAIEGRQVARSFFEEGVKVGIKRTGL